MSDDLYGDDGSAGPASRDATNSSEAVGAEIPVGMSGTPQGTVPFSLATPRTGLGSRHASSSSGAAGAEIPGGLREEIPRGGVSAEIPRGGAGTEIPEGGPGFEILGGDIGAEIPGGAAGAEIPGGGAGAEPTTMERQALHSLALQLRHPRTS